MNLTMGEVCKRNRKTTGHFIYLPFGPVQESALFLTSDWPMPVIFLHEDQHLIISVTILVEHRLSVNRESKLKVSAVTSTVSLIWGLILGVKTCEAH